MSLTREHADGKERPASLLLLFHMPRWTKISISCDACLRVGYVTVRCFSTVLIKLVTFDELLGSSWSSCSRIIQKHLLADRDTKALLSYKTRHVKCGWYNSS